MSDEVDGGHRGDFAAGHHGRVTGGGLTMSLVKRVSGWWTTDRDRNRHRPARIAALVVLSMCTAGVAVSAAQPPGVNGSIGGQQAKFIDVQGVRTRYYEAGQGEPMVLIHGGSTAGSSTANVWSRNLPGLAKRFHVFAVDRLGSGLTGNPLNDADYATKGQVEHIYQFIQALKLGKIHLVGHSAGGAAAFYVATFHPEIIRTLTIVAHGPANPPVGPGPNRLAPLLAKCPDQTVYEGLKCRVEALALSTGPPISTWRNSRSRSRRGQRSSR
jgi:hypothetical protein